MAIGQDGRTNSHERSSLDHRTIPPLGLTGQQFLEAGKNAVSKIERYYATIDKRQVLPNVEPGYLRKLLPEHPPEQGEAWTDIAGDIESSIMPGITHWQHPRYMAFFSASSTYPGILGEMWSAALTAPAFNWICSPVVTELETIVLDWLAQVLHLPSGFMSNGEGGGVIQGSASEAVATALIAARERYVRRQLQREGSSATGDEAEDRACEIRSKLVAVASAEAHSSVKKASIIAGTRFRAINVHRAKNYALTANELRPKLDQLKAQGLTPFFLSVTIGTTNTCAVDDLASIASVVKDYPDVWIHCDAAYAGAALVLPQYHHLSQQLALVDSFNLNMHKWLLTNFDASPLYVQKRRDLTDALSITPAYLKNQFTDSGLVTDYRDWQIPLGRRFRSLKIWFVLRTWGVSGLRAHIEHHIELGKLFADLVRSRADLFDILVPPAFALTVITIKARRSTATSLDANAKHSEAPPDQDSPVMITPKTADKDVTLANSNTQKVYDVINQKKEFFLTSSVVDGRTAIRVVSANPLAEEKYVREVFAALEAAAESLLD